jgi:FMN phosphatase YigB (HAD superfamily)
VSPTPIRVAFFDLGNTLVVTADRSWAPEAQAVLAELHTRGLRLGVISNTGDLSRDELSPLLPSDFDWSVFADELVILSSEAGVEKPSLEIFRRAVKAAGLDPAECLFCTEDLTDTLAAQRAGIMVARIQPPPHSDLGGLPAALAAVGAVGGAAPVAGQPGPRRAK